MKFVAEYNKSYTLIPADSGWAILVEVEAEDGTLDFEAEPIIAWAICQDPGMFPPFFEVVAVTVQSVTDPDECVWVDPNDRIFIPENRTFRDFYDALRYANEGRQKKAGERDGVEGA